MKDSSQDIETGAAKLASSADFAAPLFEIALAVAQYVFAILMVGLIGGMLGSFVDFGLAFLKPDLVGSGRTVGWFVFACLAAFGVPIGWFRPEGSPFSLASPRKQRRRLAGFRNGASPNSAKRKSLKEEVQIRKVSDVAGAVAVWGVAGAALGLALGISLGMCWFSISFSPFAPTGWTESISVETEDNFSRPEHERGRSYMTSSDPVLIGLVLYPIPILAVLGASGGCFWASTSLRRFRHAGSPTAALLDRRELSVDPDKVKNAVYITATGDSYHLADCRFARNGIPVRIESVWDELDACDLCNAPERPSD
jgi:hypothetical protein